MTTGKTITSPATVRATLVIGATSSLAQALCRELAARGGELVLAGRNEGELRLLASDLAVRHDAPARVIPLVVGGDFSAADFIENAGPFDDCVIALGDMGNGNADDAENLAHVTFLNYIIPAQLASEAARALQTAQKRGCIAIISSVAGDRGRQSNYVYGSAKAALSAFASGLRNRYARHGIHVLTVKPGFTDTPMTWAMKSPLTAGRERVASDIANAMEARVNTLYTPWFWRWIMLIIRHIPEVIFKRLSL